MRLALPLKHYETTGRTCPGVVVRGRHCAVGTEAEEAEREVEEGNPGVRGLHRHSTGGRSLLLRQAARPRQLPPGLAKKNNGCLPPGQAKNATSSGSRCRAGSLSGNCRWSFHKDRTRPRRLSLRDSRRRSGQACGWDPACGRCHRGLGSIALPHLHWMRRPAIQMLLSCRVLRMFSSGLAASTSRSADGPGRIDPTSAPLP